MDTLAIDVAGTVCDAQFADFARLESTVANKGTALNADAQEIELDSHIYCSSVKRVLAVTS